MPQPTNGFEALGRPQVAAADTGRGTLPVASGIDGPSWSGEHAWTTTMPNLTAATCRLLLIVTSGPAARVTQPVPDVTRGCPAHQGAGTPWLFCNPSRVAAKRAHSAQRCRAEPLAAPRNLHIF